MRQLPFDINDKIKQDLQTIGNNADPKMQVVVARAKSSIQDSSYFTVENIRTKAGLTDISVATRRQKVYGPPDGLFVIHIDNGVAKVLKRAYPDKLKLKWQNAFSIGPAKSVAISFDGDWERYRNTWNLVTNEFPYVFWVDNSSKLFVQFCDDTSTKYELATGVNKIKALRGWKNSVLRLQDHGILLGYIKNDGTVWYRNYCNQEDGTQAWEYAKQLEEFTGTAVNLNLFITNDYRTGFIIEDSTGSITWYLTERNWGGMASPAEKLTASVRSVMFNVIPIKQNKFDHEHHIITEIHKPKIYVCPPNAKSDLEMLEVERTDFEDKKTIQLTFNHSLICDAPRLKKAFNLSYDANNLIEIENVIVEENKITINTLEEMDLNKYVHLKYPSFNIGSYFIAYRLEENCVLDYGKEIDLSIPGLPPRVEENLSVFIDVMFNVVEMSETKVFEEEHLTSGITDLQFEVTEVFETELEYKEEHLVSGITNITFTVTMVGTSPL